MKNNAALFLAFNGRTLILRANAPDLLNRLARLFRPLISPIAFAPLAELEIHRENNGRHTLIGAKNGVIAADNPEEFLSRLEHEISLRFILANPDLLWLHAGAVAHNNRAILLAGDWGRGKSTLTAALSANDFQFLTDDICPLSLESGKLLPFPILPRARVYPNRALPRAEVRRLEKEAVILPPAAIQRQQAGIVTILFPQYRPHAEAVLRPTSPAWATAVLLQQNLNFARHGGGAVAALSRLVSNTAVYDLIFSDTDAAIALIKKKWNRQYAPLPTTTDTDDQFILAN